MSFSKAQRVLISDEESDQDSDVLSDDPEGEDGEWELHRLRGHYPCTAKRGEPCYYYVQWKLKKGQLEDWNDEENWVWETNMTCPEMLDRYWTHVEKEREKGRRSLNLQPPDSIIEEFNRAKKKSLILDHKASKEVHRSRSSDEKSKCFIKKQKPHTNTYASSTVKTVQHEGRRISEERQSAEKRRKKALKLLQEKRRKSLEHPIHSNKAVQIVSESEDRNLAESCYLVENYTGFHAKIDENYDTLNNSIIMNKVLNEVKARTGHEGRWKSKEVLTQANTQTSQMVPFKKIQPNSFELEQKEVKLHDSKGKLEESKRHVEVKDESNSEEDSDLEIYEVPRKRIRPIYISSDEETDNDDQSECKPVIKNEKQKSLVLEQTKF